MNAYQQVVAAWNAQADELNQWADLGEDEKIEWALKCADQFRDATKMVPSDHLRDATEMIEKQPSKLSDSEIDAIAEAMPGGLDGFLKGWGWRQFARAVIGAAGGEDALDAAPQQPVPAVQGDALTREQIRDVFLANGFTIKEGLTDLRPYVYDAAYALLARAQAQQGGGA